MPSHHRRSRKGLLTRYRPNRGLPNCGRNGSPSRFRCCISRSHHQSALRLVALQSYLLRARHGRCEQENVANFGRIPNSRRQNEHSVFEKCREESAVYRRRLRHDFYRRESEFVQFLALRRSRNEAPELSLRTDGQRTNVRSACKCQTSACQSVDSRTFETAWFDERSSRLARYSEVERTRRIRKSGETESRIADYGYNNERCAPVAFGDQSQDKRSFRNRVEIICSKMTNL